MSKLFREVFSRDVDDTFLNQYAEFTTWREFAFVAQAKSYNIKRLLVIWNQDVLRSLSAPVLYGQLMLGDILLLTRRQDWPQRPRRGQIIWSPRDTAWNILNCQEILHTLYRVSLQATDASL